LLQIVIQNNVPSMISRFEAECCAMIITAEARRSFIKRARVVFTRLSYVGIYVRE